MKINTDNVAWYLFRLDEGLLIAELISFCLLYNSIDTGMHECKDKQDSSLETKHVLHHTHLESLLKLDHLDTHSKVYILKHCCFQNIMYGQF